MTNGLRLTLTRLFIACCLVTAPPGFDEQLAAQHSEARSHCADVVFPIRDGELWGVIDKEGTVLVEPSYDSASHAFRPFQGGAHQTVGQHGAMLISSDEWCYVNSKGRHRMKPVTGYAWRVFNLGESLFAIEKARGQRELRGRWTRWAAVEPSAVFDPLNRWNPPAGVLPIRESSDGLLVVVRNGRFGYADRNGTIAIPTQYEAADCFWEELAPVMIDAKWGYVAKNGELVIEPQFEKALHFDGGVALVARPGGEKWFFINRDGQELHEWPHPNRTLFSEGLGKAFAPEKRLFGYCDHEGRWRIPPSFRIAMPFHEGLARVDGADPSQNGYIDRTGKLRLRLPNARTMRHFRYGLAWIEIPSKVRNGVYIPRKEGYIKPDGNWVWHNGN